jgi:hypothetical protein
MTPTDAFSVTVFLRDSLTTKIILSHVSYLKYTAVNRIRPITVDARTKA